MCLEPASNPGQARAERHLLHCTLSADDASRLTVCTLPLVGGQAAPVDLVCCFLERRKKEKGAARAANEHVEALKRQRGNRVRASRWGGLLRQRKQTWSGSGDEEDQAAGAANRSSSAQQRPDAGQGQRGGPMGAWAHARPRWRRSLCWCRGALRRTQGPGRFATLPCARRRGGPPRGATTGNSQSKSKVLASCRRGQKVAGVRQTRRERVVKRSKRATVTALRRPQARGACAPERPKGTRRSPQTHAHGHAAARGRCPPPAQRRHRRCMRATSELAGCAQCPTGALLAANGPGLPGPC
jgi:hypothetical protein